jgi:uncharacterized protein (TIGR00255 family)
VLMIRSMTGFGRGEARGETVTVTVEARSVNARHLDLALRLPRTLSGLEPEARRLVQSRLERGRVEITITFAPVPGASSARLTVDDALARDYLTQARRVASALGLSDVVSLEWVLERPGVVRLEESDTASGDISWETVASPLASALDELVERRTAEGQRLAAELRVQHAELAVAVERFAERAPAAARRREERLRERLATLRENVAVDEQRVLTEVAVWVDKTDIAEEVVRLRAHLAELQLLLDKGGPVGRPLDFLLQELNREVNTVGSKADDLELSQVVLGAKSTLERMREQVQNLE